ncbi:allophanate hydrolase subunit 2 [Aeromicrobium marinum DSM 15272]|uniref:Allophanate hydrolase subunit 2 n=1 Tax=Aeromicrobium marinum DSM 15272 TaxID=585531 RepID=E2SG19_9ACTN|nr:biotin-dependent carboxyltransferase family protein [Aeromicrobium marinum]EFQ81776.1 allophanate hydrolase subunit 2 [Aeromicrobium marinum DSM 15272]
MSLVVESAGPLTLVQDAGRPGHTGWGVSASGAFDRPAMRQSHHVLGNPAGAAVLETYGDLALRAARRHVVAVTGAPAPVLLDGRPVPQGRALTLPRGSLLRVGPASPGLRLTVGVAGGIRTPVVLGSRSRDVLADLGPDRLADGAVLSVGPAHPTPLVDDIVPTVRSGCIDLSVTPGPRDDWFVEGALEQLLTTGWAVSPQSDRIGVRLLGPPLVRSRTAELPSEPVVRGSIQVTAAGLPVVLGPDHPVTGGYPVIAVVDDADTDLLAQARPGQVVRLHRRRPGAGA